MDDVVFSSVAGCGGGEKTMSFQPLLATSELVLVALLILGLAGVGFFRQKRATGTTDALVRWGRRLLLGVFLLAILAGPGVKIERDQAVSNIEVVLAVDRTGSMAAEDGPGGAPRLDSVRHNMTTLIQHLPGARFAAVSWDSDARVELPFTTDASAAISFAEVLHQEVTAYSTGSSLSWAADTLEEVLEDAAQQRPGNARFLVLFSDGEPSGLGSHGQLAQHFEPVADLIDGGSVFGYGTAAGAPMREYLPGQGWQTDVEEPGYILDQDGVPAISSLDLDSLELIAQTLAVPLFVNPSTEQVEALAAALMEDAQVLEERGGRRFDFAYRTWIPAALMLIPLGWEVTADARTLGLLRRQRGV